MVLQYRYYLHWRRSSSRYLWGFQATERVYDRQGASREVREEPCPLQRHSQRELVVEEVVMLLEAAVEEPA